MNTILIAPTTSLPRLDPREFPVVTECVTVSPEGEPLWFYNSIETAPGNPAAPKSIRFVSGYQGETEYELDGRRLRFRSQRCPWRFNASDAGGSSWNYPDRAQFEAEHNGNHGLATFGSEPLDRDALDAFRAQIHAGADTGFYCHFRKRWVKCKPTRLRPSYTSWRKMTARSGKGLRG